MATLVCPHGLNFMSNGNWIRYLLIARMLRFIRLLMHIERFRAFVTTFLTLIHCLLPYLGTIFCILCIYCSLGLQSYKDEGTDRDFLDLCLLLQLLSYCRFVAIKFDCSICLWKLFKQK
ncbi:two pore calcium channel protein 1A-like isoform X2 [Nicotiana tomentosiformis]